MILISGIKKIIHLSSSHLPVHKKERHRISQTYITNHDTGTEPSKILVISKQPQFSEDMITYSLDMADKRHAEIVALNLDEQERDFETFQQLAHTNISTFLHKAKEAGVSFSHMVCDGPEERVVEHLYAATSGFAYVMDDVPAQLGADHAIPVYVHTQ